MADIVVVGGGILGLCAAYHLAHTDAGQITLLERGSKLATQTTGSGAGFVSLWSGGASEPEFSIERYALRFYQELAKRHDIGLKQVGTLFVALSEHGSTRQEQQYAQVRQRLGPDDVTLLDRREVCAAAPIFAPEQVHSGVYFPRGLRVSTTAAADAIGRELEALGVTVRTNVGVTGLTVERSRVVGVQTAGGPISAHCVVLAAGAWTADLARAVGVALPLFPLPVGRIVTEPLLGIPADLPTVLLTDFHGVYFREEQGGLLLGTDQTMLHGPELMRQIAGAARLTAYNDPVVPSDVREIPSDLHAYHLWVARALEDVVPALRGFTVRDARFGLPVRTPDGRHVLGEAPGLRGLYLISGDNECGVTRGPGLAELLARMITTGQSSSESIALSPARWG
jgi:sarcosine oxidase, subunit beta